MAFLFWLSVTILIFASPWKRKSKGVEFQKMAPSFVPSPSQTASVVVGCVATGISATGRTVKSNGSACLMSESVLCQFFEMPEAIWTKVEFDALGVHFSVNLEESPATVSRGSLRVECVVNA